MSKTLSIRSLVVLPLLAFAAFPLIATDAGALAQNANSSMTQDDAAAGHGAAHRSATRRTRNRNRRARQRPVRRNTAGDATDANVSMDQNTSQDAAQDETDIANANLSGGVDTDLSGTYSGPLSLTGGHQMSGDATLTVNGNQFTLEHGGMTHTGRVLAVTTRGYTGVTLYFTDITDTMTNTPLAVSVRARRRGNQLTLEPVPGARNVMRFGRAGGRRGR